MNISHWILFDYFSFSFSTLVFFLNILQGNTIVSLYIKVPIVTNAYPMIYSGINFYHWKQIDAIHIKGVRDNTITERSPADSYFWTYIPVTNEPPEHKIIAAEKT